MPAASLHSGASPPPKTFDDEYEDEFVQPAALLAPGF
jgi:hypothetical protein